MTKACLIVGHEGDVHAAALERELKERGVPTLFFAADAEPDECFLTYSFAGHAQSLTIRRRDRSFNADDIGSVFWRAQSSMQGWLSLDADLAEENFRLREWTKAVDGLSSAFASARWVNPLETHGHSANKVLQLRVAQQVGFTIPRTVVSNDAREIEPLFDEGPVIYKTLATAAHSHDKVILTTQVNKADFLERREHLSAAPCLFQALVPKAYELRVTVIGRSVMAVRINSQAHEHTKVDWRADQHLAGLYEPTVLPASVNALIFKIMARLGLVYGAFDFIVTPDGSYVFLEVNPGGQWLFLEEATHTPITAEIAAFLATGRPLRFGVGD